MEFFKIFKYAFNYSDIFGQGIVLFLFAISIFLWSYSIAKILELKAIEKANNIFRAKFMKVNSILELVFEPEIPSSNLQRIYYSFIEAIMIRFELSPQEAQEVCKKRVFPRSLNIIDFDIINTTLTHSIDNEDSNIQNSLGNLATIVAASPFFGLLGTVWGVMAAFCGMAQKNSADIGALAPGISGALLTTVVGLLVAIPSLICYNTITSKVEKINGDMERFSDELEMRLKIESEILNKIKE